MKEQIQKRLKELKDEFEAGQKMLADLEAKEANLRETILRISGAIQVLEEELLKREGATKEGQDLGKKGDTGMSKGVTKGHA